MNPTFLFPSFSWTVQQMKLFNSHRWESLIKLSCFFNRVVSEISHGTLLNREYIFFLGHNNGQTSTDNINHNVSLTIVCGLLYMFYGKSRSSWRFFSAQTPQNLIHCPVCSNSTPKLLLLCNYLYLRSFQ